MFNMYDDEGVKTQVTNLYQVKKLEPTSMIKNKITKDKEERDEKQKFQDTQISNEAKNAYKKMANIHVEEEVLHAYQLMSSKIVTVKPHDTIYDCWALMYENDLKQIPIVGLDGKLKGLATMKNITKTLVEQLDSPQYIYQTHIDTIARYDIMTAEPIADIRRVANVMVTYHLNSIPIVSAKTDEVVGIISRADILKAVSSMPHFQLWA